MKILFLLAFLSFSLFAQEGENSVPTGSAPTPAVSGAKVETSVGPAEKKTGLFLYTKINLLNFMWKDLSVEGEDSFITPLNQNWVEWFKQNQTQFQLIEPCSQSCEVEFNTWIEGANLDQRSGVWIKTDLNLRRLVDEKFEISGGIVFLDIESRKNLGARTLELQKISLPILDLKKRNSALASYLFRASLPFYTALMSGINSEKDARSLLLVIKGFTSLSDIQALEKLLAEKNSNLNLKSSLVGFARQQAQLNITFKGEEKLFTDLLSELKELKSSRRFTLVHEFIENTHVLKMIAE